MTNTKVTFKIVYSILIAMLPILSIYRDPLNIAEWGTILLLLFSPYILLKCWNYRSKIGKKGYIYLVVFLIDAAASIYIWGKYTNNYSSTASLALLIMAYILIINLYGGLGRVFDYTIAARAVQIVSLFNATLIIIQALLHYLFNSYANIVVTSWLVSDAEHYKTYLYSGITNGSFRPAGFFLEPSHFALFAIVALVTLLFSPNKVHGYLAKSLFIIFGIVLSTSGIGISMAFTILLLSLFRNNKLSIKKVTKIFFGIFGLALIIFVVSQFDVIKFAVDRVFTGDIRTSAVYPRIYNMLFFFDAPMNIQLLGNGFLTFPVSYYSYYNGAIKLLYGQGYIGMAILLLFLIVRYRNSIGAGKLLIFCFAVLFVAAEMYSTIYLCFYLMFICSLDAGYVNHFFSQRILVNEGMCKENSKGGNII